MSVKTAPSPASPPISDRLRFLNTLPKHPNITVGDYTYGNEKFIPSVRWMSGNATDPKLTIGKYCSFANDVIIIMGGNHRSDWITTYPFLGPTEARQTPVTKGDVTIGNDVWVASEAMILSGVTIGDGAVLGFGSVIAGSVIADGKIILGEVRIGAGATLGVYSVAMGSIDIGDNAKIVGGSVLVPGSAIPAGEVWRGNPARKWISPGAPKASSAAD